MNAQELKALQRGDCVHDAREQDNAIVIAPACPDYVLLQGFSGAKWMAHHSRSDDLTFAT